MNIRPRGRRWLKTANFAPSALIENPCSRAKSSAIPPSSRCQPRAGVDICPIEFIHKRIVAMRDRARAVLLVSVELDEIFALSDRILVLCAGRITG